jgi:hypothetical protein
MITRKYKSAIFSPFYFSLLQDFAIVRGNDDSTSWKGFRHKQFVYLPTASVDTTTKESLILHPGNPYYIQRSSKGLNGYVSYVYFVYKDYCPKIGVDGLAIEFIFDDSETRLIKISDIVFCG